MSIPASARHTTGRRLRLLVVDDEVGLTESIGAAFGFRGWQVRIAHNCAQAIEIATAQQPDLVILDVALPDGTGFELLPAIRATNPYLCVLFLTARDGVLDRVHGIEIGGDDYLTKPFHLGELTARAEGLVRRAGLVRQQAGAVVMIADLHLDLDAHEVNRGDRRIELTATEFALLRELAKASPRVVPKEDLLEEVWNDRYANPHVLELYISYLRKKVGDGLIHTVRGVGYQLRGREGASS